MRLLLLMHKLHDHNHVDIYFGRISITQVAGYLLMVVERDGHECLTCISSYIMLPLQIRHPRKD